MTTLLTRLVRVLDSLVHLMYTQPISLRSLIEVVARSGLCNCEGKVINRDLWGEAVWQTLHCLFFYCYLSEGVGEDT